MTAILPRKNSLIRPAVANVDQAFVIFAMENPKPNFMLLDRQSYVLTKKILQNRKNWSFYMKPIRAVDMM